MRRKTSFSSFKVNFIFRPHIFLGSATETDQIWKITYRSHEPTQKIFAENNI